MRYFLLVIFLCVFGTQTIAASMRTGTIEKVIFKSKHGAQVKINGKLYGYNKNVLLSSGKHQLRYSSIEPGYQVRYELHYPLGTGAVITSMDITGPPEVLKLIKETRN